MKRFAIPALILAPLALAGVAVASSQGGGDCHRKGPMGHHRGGPPIELIAGALDLDEGQTAELESLADEFMGAHEGRRQAHEAFREAAAAELSAENPDFDKLVSQASAEAEAMHATHLDAISAIASFAEGLSPEQRARLAEHLENGPPHRRH